MRPRSLKTVILTGGDYLSDGAFKDCVYIEKVVIGDDIVSIGKRSFAYCESLSEIKLGKGVRFIDEEAFAYSALATVKMGDNVSNLGKSAFSHCTALKTVELSPSITWIHDATFKYCTSLTDIVLPDGVLYVGSEAFAMCESLKSISIPDGILNVEPGAFDGCVALKGSEYENGSYLGNHTNPYIVLLHMPATVSEVKINESTKIIYGGAFSNCASLEKIRIPNNVEYINEYIEARLACDYCIKNVR